MNIMLLDKYGIVLLSFVTTEYVLQRSDQRIFLCRWWLSTYKIMITIYKLMDDSIEEKRNKNVHV